MEFNFQSAIVRTHNVCEYRSSSHTTVVRKTHFHTPWRSPSPFTHRMDVDGACAWGKYVSLAWRRPLYPTTLPASSAPHRCDGNTVQRWRYSVFQYQISYYYNVVLSAKMGHGKSAKIGGMVTMFLISGIAVKTATISLSILKGDIWWHSFISTEKKPYSNWCWDTLHIDSLLFRTLYLLYCCAKQPRTQNLPKLDWRKTVL